MPDSNDLDGTLVRYTGDLAEARAQAAARHPLATADPELADEAPAAADDESRGRHEAPDAPTADAPIETTAAPRASDAK